VLDVIAALGDSYEYDEAFALATVVRTWRSAPRPIGATMVVSAGGEAAGSVSGGCVEGAVYELAQDVMATGHPVLQRYGVSDDDAFAVGLTCGGIIDVFVERVSAADWPELADVIASLRRRESVAVVRVIEGSGRQRSHLAVWPDRTAGTLGAPRLDRAVARDVRSMLEAGRNGSLLYGAEGKRLAADLELFVQSFAPPPKLLIFGAIDFASALARMGSFLGFHVTVCDARAVFATRKRFPDADEVVVDWPHRHLASVEVDERTAICVLTHDPKFDVPLLEAALRTPARYIGAMGSRRTHEQRLDRLREVGVPEELLQRVASPIGLDLGARTPEETAVSIAAEMIAHQWGGTGRSLTGQQGPIHADGN
jgi:xanthine dehydrogenase accessory factor